MRQQHRFGRHVDLNVIAEQIRNGRRGTVIGHEDNVDAGADPKIFQQKMRRDADRGARIKACPDYPWRIAPVQPANATGTAGMITITWGSSATAATGTKSLTGS